MFGADFKEREDDERFYEMFPQYPRKTWPEVLYPTKLKTQYDQMQQYRQLAHKPIEGYHTPGSRILSGFGNILNSYNAKQKEKQFDQTLDEYWHEMMRQPAPGQRPTSLMRNLQSAGYQPGTPEYQQAMQRIMFRPQASTTVNVGAGPNAFSKAMGENQADYYQQIGQRADTAQQQLYYLDQAEAINQPTDEGELPSWFQQQVGNFATAMGLPQEAVKAYTGRVTDGQSFEGVMSEMVLTKLQAQKGPQTERDAQRIQQTVASLANTPEARTFLLKSARALSMRDIEKKRFYDDWLKKTRSPQHPYGDMTGADEAWQQHVGGTPLIGTNPKSGLPVFYYEFLQKHKEMYPDMTEQEIKQRWVQKYG